MPIKIYANPYTVYYKNATNSILSLFYHDFLLFWWLVMNWQRWDLNSESHSSCACESAIELQAHLLHSIFSPDSHSIMSFSKVILIQSISALSPSGMHKIVG
jgi:hypothetical protein